MTMTSRLHTTSALAGFYLLIASCACAQSSFVLTLQQHITDFSATQDPETHTKILDDLDETIYKRTGIFEDEEVQELSAAETEFMVREVLPVALIASGADDRVLRSHGFALTSTILNICTDEVDRQESALLEVLLKAANDTDPMYDVSTGWAISLLYRYFSPTVDVTRLFLKRSLQPECTVDLAGKIFSKALAHASAAPELFSDIEVTLKSAESEKKRCFLDSLDSGYWLDKNYIARCARLEDDVIHCLQDKDINIQSAALHVLGGYCRRGYVSEASVDAVAVMAMDSARNDSVRTHAVMQLGVFARFGDQESARESLALITRNPANDDELRIDAIGRYIGGQPTPAALDAFVASFASESNPHIIEALDDYLEMTIKKESGTAKPAP